MATANYDHLNEEARQWLKDLNFYRDEVAYFSRQLEEVSAKEIRSEVIKLKSHVAEKQSQIEQLKKLILKSEQHLAERMELADRMNISIEEDHHSLNPLMDKFSRDFYKLRNEFNTTFPKSKRS